jgi:hypothetical protein
VRAAKASVVLNLAIASSVTSGVRYVRCFIKSVLFSKTYRGIKAKDALKRLPGIESPFGKGALRWFVHCVAHNRRSKCHQKLPLERRNAVTLWPPITAGAHRTSQLQAV